MCAGLVTSSKEMAELTGSENDHQPDFSHETYQTDLGSDADGRSIMTTVESSGKSQSSTYMEISIDTINTSTDKSHIEARLDDSSSELMNTSTDEIKLGPDGDNTNIDKQPLEKKLRQSFIPGDVSSVDSGKLTTDSVSSSGSKHGSTSGSSSNKSPQHQGKDTSRKDKEREEKIRQQREKLAEERQKKIEEMKEQQRMAQEKREKQLELRRMKIDELRRRDEERRTAVEERRKKQEEVDKARREAILQKSAERITRYEQWKASGRKGGVRGPYGFGSRAPREVCQPLDRRRSSSHSTLYRRSPNGSDSDTYRPQRRAVSACSVVRRHCCIDINKLNGYPGSSPPSKLLSMSTSVLYHKRSPDFSSSGNLSARDRPDSLLALNTIPENSRSFLAPSGPPPTRPKSTFNLSNREHVKMRDKARAERKPRPKSVAGSIPSFIQMESTTSPKTRDQKATSRSKSTDRIARDRQKAVPSPRATSKREKDDINKQEKSAISEDKKDVKKRLEIKRPTPEKKKPDVKKTEDNKKDVEKGDKSSEKPAHKISQKTLDRLSTPKQGRDKSETRPETPTKEQTPVKVTKKSVKIIAPTPPSRKSKTPKPKEKRIKESPVKVTTKDTSGAEVASEEKEAPSSVKEVSEIKEPSPEPTTVDETVSTVQVSEEKVSTVITSETIVTEEDKVEESPREDIKSESDEEPQEPPPETATPVKQDQKVADLKKADQKPSTPATPQTEKEKEMMEYKAKLAEKRRQAREKAEREAELERQRQEELERQEEERIRQEEEEQRRMEEEAHRLAEVARKQEEERLRKAIEAEEQRKKEEAERLEKERLAKEEADRKAKEEAEKAEIERQEKLKKEEEERQERKKRLEMIMKRVKSDTPLSSPASSPALAETKPTDSPNKSLTSSPSKSSYASTESLSDDKSQENGVTFSLDDKKETLDNKLLETPKFKSPLLQKLVESKQSQNGGSETPKFKSPLLQNLLGKKAGSRLGLDRSDGEKSDSEATSDSERYGDTADSSEELEDRGIEECTSDTNETVDNSDSTLRMDSSVDMSESLMEKSDTGSDMFSEQKDSSVIKSSDSSDILVSINGPSQNGDMGGHYQKELVDSSISMRTVDSLGTSVTTDSSLYGSLIDSQTASSYSAGGEEQVSSTTSTAHTASGDFEEYIDLNVNNRNTIINNSEDLLNFNSIDNKLDNITTGEDSHPKPPIIAFEDNATRRQEVTDLLS